MVTIIQSRSAGHTTDVGKKPPIRQKTAKELAEDHYKQLVLRGSREVFTERLIITPELAEVMLENNPDNRPISQVALARLEQDIKEGAYMFNGETIIVAEDGTVNDGQHRLWAAFNTNTPIDSLVVFGVPRHSRFTVDTGTVRTVGHMLGMNGVGRGRDAGTIAKYLIQVERYGHIMDSSRTRPTTSEIQLKYYEEREAIDEALDRIPTSGSHTAFASKGLMATFYVLISKRSKPAAEDFIEMMLTGAVKTNDKNHPVLIARTRMTREAKKLRPSDKLELMLKAWNAWRTGKAVRAFEITDKLPKIAS